LRPDIVVLKFQLTKHGWGQFCRWRLPTDAGLETVRGCQPLFLSSMTQFRISASARVRILAGDIKGGGHRFGTNRGKSEFPQSWSDDDIIAAIKDVANDPASIHAPDGARGTYHLDWNAEIRQHHGCRQLRKRLHRNWISDLIGDRSFPIAESDILIANRIASLLGDAGASWSALERAEVERFLHAGEHGLAVDTLSWILVDARKPISSKMLREIERLIVIMDLGQEPFVAALHGAYQRQAAAGNGLCG
jgi:hypothetical protein